MQKKKKQPYILGFYGQSGIGKTYVLRQIVAQLKREGFKVAVIKISDKAISIDTKGKDTYLYGEAGADMVVFSSASESAFLVKRSLPTHSIVDQLTRFDTYDFIFIEGAMEAWIPKIRLGDIARRENTLKTYDGNYDELIRTIRERSLKGEANE